MGGKISAARVPAALGAGGGVIPGAAGTGAPLSRGSSCSRQLAAGVGSDTDLAAGSICEMAEKQAEEGAEHMGNSPTAVPGFGLRGQ